MTGQFDQFIDSVEHTHHNIETAVRSLVGRPVSDDAMHGLMFDTWFYINGGRNLVLRTSSKTMRRGDKSAGRVIGKTAVLDHSGFCNLFTREVVV